MKPWLMALALVACGTGVREVKTAGGESIFETKCKQGTAECFADAKSKCPDGYEVLDSESHAGGLVADALPGPVTWNTITFKCNASASSEKTTFEHRGAPYQPPPTFKLETGHTKARGDACHNDYDCDAGMYCAKGQYKSDGVCADK